MKKKKILATGFALLLALAWASSDDTADLEAIRKIKDEASLRSQVMETLSYLTDVYGPRLAGSSNYRRAAEWAQERLETWGLENIRTESFHFGRTWELEKLSAHMIEPAYSPLIAFPKAWTPGTSGVIRAEAVRVEIQKEEDLGKYRGKLKGLFVLAEPPREVEAHFKPEARRFSEEELRELAKPAAPSRAAQPEPDKSELRRKIAAFFVQEKVAAVLEPGPGDGGSLFVAEGGSYRGDAQPVATQLVLAVEHYNRICRILDRKVKVQLEIEIQVDLDNREHDDLNILADLPGTDKRDELVMLGGHLDSWHAGTGATDDASGCAVAMEAMRILKATGLAPRRTVRLALWGAEELGMLGSRAYVESNFAAPPTPPAGMQRGTEAYRKWMEHARRTPPILKPEWSRLSAYFNLDNGSGRIRGIYLQGNEAVRPIFEAWLAPFRDMDATTLSIRGTDSTDHVSFDAVGLPGFQFIQDPLEYYTRTHHSNMDVYDRVQREDLIQSATIMASFVYHTAMREQMLPRKPMSAAE